MDKGITVIGMDVSDRKANLYTLATGENRGQEERLPLTRQALQRRFGGTGRYRVVMETGTHSPWLSRLLESQGHDVVVADARRVRLISQSDRKTDRADAECLARLGRSDLELLKPVRHRSAQAQADLAAVRSRDALVRARTMLVNHVRGAVKSMGYRLPTCSTKSFASKVMGSLPEELRPALTPLVGQIEQLTEQIEALKRELEGIAKARYPHTALLQQIPGVGPITSLTYVLVIEDPARFSKSRKVGAYLGLTARQNQSGERDVRSRTRRPATATSGGCCWSARTTSWGGSDRTAIFAGAAWRSRRAVGRSRRNGHGWRLPGSSLSCCAGCGVPEPCTSRYVLPRRRLHEPNPKPV